MDTQQLEQRYPNGIPDDVKEHLKNFQNLVDNKGALSVKVLSNFGLDVEQSFSKGFNIYKGFVLELDASYRLDTTDVPSLVRPAGYEPPQADWVSYGEDHLARAEP